MANLPAEDDLNEKYDPMSRDELIARCEQLEGLLREAIPGLKGTELRDRIYAALPDTREAKP